MKNIKIALIDTGVDINNFNLYEKSIIGVKIIEHNGHFHFENSLIDENGHGTAICGIILSKCSNVEIISIKILNNELKCTLDQLIEAIKFAINENVSIINLSLGILDKEDKKAKIKELIKICNIAIKKRIYIVSAYSNYDKSSISIPANLNNVVGVKSGYIYDKYGYSFDISTMNVISNGVFQKVMYKDNSTCYIAGNSFACAHFSGILASFMDEFPNVFKDTNKAMQFLKERSVEYKEIQCDHNIWNVCHKIIYFPISEETLNMPSKAYKYGFEVVGFYDIRNFKYNFFNCKVDKNIKQIKIYKDLNEALAIADSLFIGDLNFINDKNRKIILNNTIQEALKHGKNVYVKNPFPYDEFYIFKELAEKNNVIFAATYIYK